MRKKATWELFLGTRIYIIHAPGTDTLTTVCDLRLGANSEGLDGADGLFAEVLDVDGCLSREDCDSVYEYLRHKWIAPVAGRARVAPTLVATAPYGEKYVQTACLACNVDRPLAEKALKDWQKQVCLARHAEVATCGVFDAHAHCYDHEAVNTDNSLLLEFDALLCSDPSFSRDTTQKNPRRNTKLNPCIFNKEPSDKVYISPSPTPKREKGCDNAYIYRASQTFEKQNLSLFLSLSLSPHTHTHTGEGIELFCIGSSRQKDSSSKVQHTLPSTVLPKARWVWKVSRGSFQNGRLAKLNSVGARVDTAESFGRLSRLLSILRKERERERESLARKSLGAGSRSRPTSETSGPCSRTDREPRRRLSESGEGRERQEGLPLERERESAQRVRKRASAERKKRVRQVARTADVARAGEWRRRSDSYQRGLEFPVEDLGDESQVF